MNRFVRAYLLLFLLEEGDPVGKKTVIFLCALAGKFCGDELAMECLIVVVLVHVQVHLLSDATCWELLEVLATFVIVTTVTLWRFQGCVDLMVAVVHVHLLLLLVVRVPALVIFLYHSSKDSLEIVILELTEKIRVPAMH